MKDEDDLGPLGNFICMLITLLLIVGALLIARLGFNYYFDNLCIDTWSQAGRAHKIIRHQCFVQDDAGNFVHEYDYREKYRYKFNVQNYE